MHAMERATMPGEACALLPFLVQGVPGNLVATAIAPRYALLNDLSLLHHSDNSRINAKMKQQQ